MTGRQPHDLVFGQYGMSDLDRRPCGSGGGRTRSAVAANVTGTGGQRSDLARRGLLLCAISPAPRRQSGSAIITGSPSKQPAGRKSDVSDGQWIQRLHTFGLLRGSFRPTAEITAIRTLLRHRDTLVEGAVACIQRRQKALTLMNLQLHHVISDVTGVTGMLILRDIVASVTDPTVLARHRPPPV